MRRWARARHDRRFADAALGRTPRQLIRHDPLLRLRAPGSPSSTACTTCRRATCTQAHARQQNRAWRTYEHAFQRGHRERPDEGDRPRGHAPSTPRWPLGTSPPWGTWTSARGRAPGGRARLERVHITGSLDPLKTLASVGATAPSPHSSGGRARQRQFNGARRIRQRNRWRHRHDIFQQSRGRPRSKLASAHMQATARRAGRQSRGHENGRASRRGPKLVELPPADIEMNQRDGTGAAQQKPRRYLDRARGPRRRATIERGRPATRRRPSARPATAQGGAGRTVAAARAPSSPNAARITGFAGVTGRVQPGLLTSARSRPRWVTPPARGGHERTDGGRRRRRGRRWRPPIAAARTPSMAFLARGARGRSAWMSGRGRPSYVGRTFARNTALAAGGSRRWLRRHEPPRECGRRRRRGRACAAELVRAVCSLRLLVVVHLLHAARQRILRTPSAART